MFLMCVGWDFFYLWNFHLGTLFIACKTSPQKVNHQILLQASNNHGQMGLSQKLQDNYTFGYHQKKKTPMLLKLKTQLFAL
jgi:hypothetical protein